MEDKTTEFSFILKQSKYGVGVFTTHEIEKDTHLRLFENGDETQMISAIRNKKDIPDFFQEYCIDRGETMHCPVDFGRVEIGWYMNHSKKPNAYHRNYEYYTLRDIKKNEEIFIDYNTLDEAEEFKSDYYKN